MSQIDVSQASPVADTFLRRFAAAALDVVFVALPTILLAALSSERFSIIEQTNDRARFSVPEQLRINEIDQGLNRAMQFGDTVITLSGAGLWVTLLTLAMLTVLVFFVIPGLQQGQTPGRSLLRLPVRSDDDGGVELLSMSVTDAAPEADAGPPPEPRRARAAAARTRPTEPDHTDPGFVLTEPKVADPVEAPMDQTTDGAAVSAITTAPAADSAATSAMEAATHSTADTATDTTVQPVAGMAQAATTRPDVAPALDLSTSAVTDAGQPTSSGRGDAAALVDLVRADIERGRPVVQVTLGDDNDYDQWGDLDDLDLVDRHEETPKPDSSFDTLTLPESSLSETPLTATIGPGGATARAAGTTVTVDRETNVEQGATARVEPEWSAEWQSWVYRDDATGRWYRHDEDAGRWVPIGD